MSYEINEANIAETIVRESRKPQLLSKGNDRCAMYAVPDGFSLQTDSALEKLQNRPWRKTGAIRVKTADSFIHYVNTHKREETLLYAKVDPRNIDTPLQITAVFNEHQGGVVDDSEPGWRDFSAVLIPESSHEWKTWNAHNGKAMSQFEFAMFVDNNSKDISSQDGYPTGIEMLKMATQFEANQDKQFRSAVRLQSGGADLQFIDTDDATTVEKMRAFDKFMIGLPAFWMGQAYLLEAKLRYRVHSGKLSLWYDLIRPDLVINDAVETILANVQEKTNLPVLYGEIIK
ncbi:DUF2303 family protein [Allopusillimonas ginsengisoli]|uniref:DUF2303 family protein n=1 Tax=Allopusillimonas ginsengisoli TaxID=453575 RepID=UPI0039C2FFFD